MFLNLRYFPCIDGTLIFDIVVDMNLRTIQGSCHDYAMICVNDTFCFQFYICIHTSMFTLTVIIVKAKKIVPFILIMFVYGVM